MVDTENWSAEAMGRKPSGGVFSKHYPASFKARVILKVLREETTPAQIAPEHKVHATMLYRWRRMPVEGTCLPHCVRIRKGWSGLRPAATSRHHMWWRPA